MSLTLTFENLAEQIKSIHQTASTHAKGSINRSMTLRNWLIGCYIVEFEQHGRERAEYGAYLLKSLEARINERGLNQTLFKICRQFYLTYPQIGSIVSHHLGTTGDLEEIGAMLSHQSIEDTAIRFRQEDDPRFVTNPELLVSKLSFSHIREILTIDDSFERFFYEFECMKGGWSVKELRRQIGTNLYFRAGISKKPEQLLTQIVNYDQNALINISDPFTFEFLGLEAKDAVSESDLEQALMDHLQEFLLEMGRGFCFEARQKRIVIDDQYYFPDLILYNRILHCSVIVELKNEPFSHENLGQLNAYVAYYKKHEMYPGDNPPVGILLCTKKGTQMVEYALSGMDNQLFVSTYMLHLPGKDELREFLLKQMEYMGYSD